MLQLITWIIFSIFLCRSPTLMGPRSTLTLANCSPSWFLTWLSSTCIQLPKYAQRLNSKVEIIDYWLLNYFYLHPKLAFREKENMLLLVSKSRNINDINIYFKLYNDLILFSVKNWFLTVFQSQNYYHYSTGRLILIKKNNCFYRLKPLLLEWRKNKNTYLH